MSKHLRSAAVVLAVAVVLAADIGAAYILPSILRALDHPETYDPRLIANLAATLATLAVVMANVAIAAAVLAYRAAGAKREG